MLNDKTTISDMVVYFDGKRTHFGKIYNKVFVHMNGTFGWHIKDEIMNRPIENGKPSILQPREFMDYNTNLIVNTGFDGDEEKYLNQIYAQKEMSVTELLKHEATLSSKVYARLRLAEQTKNLAEMSRMQEVVQEAE